MEVLINEFGFDVDLLATPGICLDCSPVVEMSCCIGGHGVGKESPLIAAALSGQLDSIRFLIARDANVNMPNEV